MVATSAKGGLAYLTRQLNQVVLTIQVTLDGPAAGHWSQSLQSVPLALAKASAFEILISHLEMAGANGGVVFYLRSGIAGDNSGGSTSGFWQSWLDDRECLSVLYLYNYVGIWVLLAPRLLRSLYGQKHQPGSKCQHGPNLLKSLPGDCTQVCRKTAKTLKLQEQCEHCVTRRIRRTRQKEDAKRSAMEAKVTVVPGKVYAFGRSKRGFSKGEEAPSAEQCMVSKGAESPLFWKTVSGRERQNQSFFGNGLHALNPTEVDQNPTNFFAYVELISKAAVPAFFTLLFLLQKNFSILVVSNNCSWRQLYQELNVTVKSYDETKLVDHNDKRRQHEENYRDDQQHIIENVLCLIYLSRKFCFRKSLSREIKVNFVSSTR